MSYAGKVYLGGTFSTADGDIHIFDVYHGLYGWDSMSPAHPLYFDNWSRKNRRRGYSSEESLRERITGVKW